MNRYLYILLIALLPVVALGQEREHLVKRGESIASISALYGIDEQALMAANPRLNDFCVVGMKLVIPASLASIDNAESAESKDLDRVSSLWEEGDYAFNRKDYKKAAKLYTEALDINSNNPHLHYNLGLCYFNREKYKKAVDEFGYCIYRSQDEEISKKAKELQAVASERLAEERERRREIWSAVGIAAAGTALAVGTALVASQSTPSTYQSRPSYSTSGGRISNATLDQIDAYANQEIMRNRQQFYQTSAMNYAIRTQMNMNKMNENARKFEQNNRVLGVTMTFWAEWQKNPSQDHTMLFTRVFQDKYGCAPSIEELNYFQEVFISGLARMSGGSSEEESSNSNDSYSGTTISSSGSRIVCSLCHGTGRIAKDTNPPDFGLTDYKKKCNECGEYYYASSGHTHITCPNCHGHKYID